MKKNLLLFISICSVILIACQSKQEEATVQKNPNRFDFNPTDSIVVDTDSIKQAGEMIPLDTAKVWIENYQQFMSSLYQKNASGEIVPLAAADILHGFTYRTEDLLTALGIENSKLPNNVPHIRGYIGMTSIEGSFTYKLLLLAAVDASLDKKSGNMAAGKDAFFIAKKKSNQGLTDESEGFVLDLNYPCPTLCPDNGSGARRN